MSTLSTIQAAMEKAVTLLNEIGTSATYTPKATGTAVDIKVMHRELSTLELVGDYRQGDLRIECDASKLAAKPARYDTLLIGDRTYTVRDPNGAARMVGDKVYVYKFVVRGS